MPAQAGLVEEVLALVLPTITSIVSSASPSTRRWKQHRSGRGLGWEGEMPEQVHIVNDKVGMKAAVAAEGLRVPRMWGATRRSHRHLRMQLLGLGKMSPQTRRWNCSARTLLVST